MEFEPEFVEALQQAVTPSHADILIARGVILDSLREATEPVLLTTFEAAWLTSIGGQAPAERTTLQAVPSNQPSRRFVDPTSDDPHILVVRCRHALRWAIAQLHAEGKITRGPGNQHPINPDNLSITYPGGGGSVPITVHSPYIGDDGGSTPRYMSVRDTSRPDEEALLPADEMLAGLDELLGSRGEELIRESQRALRAGLYLASSSMLAAASEAAWFNLARSVPAPGAKLTELVESGRDIAQVIKLTEQHLHRVPRSQTKIAEVVAQAHLFRDIRNYALHPVEDHDQDREIWLTESGSTVLAIAARRYFVKMASLQRRIAEDSASQTRAGSRPAAEIPGSPAIGDVYTAPTEPVAPQ